MASFKDCIDFPYYAIYLSFNEIEFRNEQITAMDYKKSHPSIVEFVSMLMSAAIFVSKLSLKIVRFNVAVLHTAEA